MFDPNAAADPDSGVFGLSFTETNSELILLSIPWEVTTSYGGGTANAPLALLEASHQLDLYHPKFPGLYQRGIHMRDSSSVLFKKIKKLGIENKKHAQSLIKKPTQKRKSLLLKKVNSASQTLNQLVFKETKALLSKGKRVGIAGGDHSVPFGAIQAAGQMFGDFGVLHFDAHYDLRDAYQGFQHSHASIFRNVAEQVPEMRKLVQVGIRDFCEDELNFAKSQKSRFVTFFDRDLSKRKMSGTPWSEISDDILGNLPKKVWVSFDIDGLDPRFCPHTGTPVPGGLDFNEVIFLLERLIDRGQEVIGFDLVEVAPHPKKLDEWDANVGMRLLFELCMLTLHSKKNTGNS